MGFTKCMIKHYAPLEEFADEFDVLDGTWGASQLDELPFLQFVSLFTKSDGCIMTATLKNGKIMKVDLPKSKRAPDVYVSQQIQQLVQRMALNKDASLCESKTSTSYNPLWIWLAPARQQSGIQWI